MEDNKSLDILGIKPLGDAGKLVITKSIEGIESFLAMVCKPALEEFGLMLKDKSRIWRLNNVIKTLEKSGGKLKFLNDRFEINIETIAIDPRVAIEIIDKSSYCQDDDLQELWAGLFVSSCTTLNSSDENLFFINILNSLTCRQVKILEYCCSKCKKIVYDNEFLFGDDFEVQLEKLLIDMNLTRTDAYIIDRELDYLSSIKLLGSSVFNGGGINLKDKIVNLTPSPLALGLYVKCQGYNGNPTTYWEDVNHKLSSDLKSTDILAVNS